ncbi:MAG: DEAD/DEAH box helicase [Methanomicrobiaceae archaeon]|nr:DEAD/DEAH box helicase [Methanomicrobiaceae archaeon]
MTVPDLLAGLAADPHTGACMAHVEVIPAKGAVYAALDRPLPDVLEAYLKDRDIRLYSHQSHAIEAIRRGESIILTTETASGKSLAFSLPVFETLSHDGDATALLLYPTKALANDQLAMIRGMEKYSGIPAQAAIYDGDTPSHRRSQIRSSSRVILSNPHEIHQILPWHHKWSFFLGNLQYIVIDEAHRYRGVFGSHVAFLLRRLLRIARMYGAEPQFILSTATIANPGEFARKLTGKHTTLIASDGAPHGRQYFVLYNPFATGDDGRSTHRETVDLMQRCIRVGMQTLVFTVSRRMAEVIAMRVRQLTPEYPISAYRAGYLPLERRALEEGLQEGRVHGAVTTNALEVGIDIGSLDAVIISGFPGTMAAARQQAGRAGRRGGDALAVLVGFHNPLDQFFMHNPDAFFSRSHEHAIVDLENPYIIGGHILCAAAESPLRPAECPDLFGDDAPRLITSFEQQGLLKRGREGWLYAGRGRAVEATSLTGTGTDGFQVFSGGRVIETLSRAQAFREAHPGAVLLHQKDTFLVEDFDLETGRIRVRAENLDIHTEPLTNVDVNILLERAHFAAGGVEVFFGDVEVVETTSAYRVKRYDEVIRTLPLDLPPLRFATRAFWFTIPETMVTLPPIAACDLGGALHATEHALIGMMPFLVQCDRRDVGGVSSSRFPGTGLPTVIVYDGHEGGVGIAEKAFELFPDLCKAACSLVESCACTEGCPSCILSPKCGSDNMPLDKKGARGLLAALCSAFPSTG